MLFQYIPSSKARNANSILEDLVIARIRIYPPHHEGTPLELRVDEMDIIRGVFNPVEDF
jgi:hypothetical protein